MGVVRVVQVAALLYPFRGDHAESLHAQGRSFALTGPKMVWLPPFPERHQSAKMGGI